MSDYAVRVIVRHESGDTSERDYVRTGTYSRLSKSAFAAFALGDLLSLTNMGFEIGPILSATVTEIDRKDVR